MSVGWHRSDPQQGPWLLLCCCPCKLPTTSKAVPPLAARELAVELPQVHLTPRSFGQTRPASTDVDID